MENFARLRELLSEPPSSKVWENLWNLFGKWEYGEELFLAQNYAFEHMSSWKEYMCERSDISLDHPGWPLVKRLAYRARELPQDYRLLLEALEQSPQIEVLHLGYANLPQSTQEYLLKGYFHSPAFANIQGLWLALTETSPQLSQQIFESPTLESLRSLTLQFVPVNKAGLDTVFSGEAVFSLDTFRLFESNLDPSFFQDFSAWEGLQTIEEFWLGDFAINDVFAQAFSSCPHWTSLTRLLLTECELDVPQVEKLFQNRAFSLKELDLSGNPLDDSLAQVFQRQTGFDLTTLELQETRISDETASAIAGLVHFQNLETLELSRTEVTDKGMLSMLHSQNFQKLHTLGLHGTRLSGKVLRRVLDSEAFPSLKYLFLSKNHLQTSEVKQLQEDPRVLFLG